MTKHIHWLDAPEKHDFGAAEDYLSLLFEHAGVLVDDLRTGPVTARKAKDILRASRLPALGKDNFHVAKDMHKIGQGGKLSPILLVRVGDRVEIADGYHRVCAVYLVDEEAEIPCVLV